jgi:hypothetical protein
MCAAVEQQRVCDAYYTRAPSRFQWQLVLAMESFVATLGVPRLRGFFRLAA